MHLYIEAIGFLTQLPQHSPVAELPNFNGRVGRESGRTEQKGERESNQSYLHHKVPSCVEGSLLQKLNVAPVPSSIQSRASLIRPNSLSGPTGARAKPEQ
jgi:hypothetical protein